MRAEMRKRRRNRRLAVALSVVAVAALIVVVAYVTALPGQGSPLDSRVNQPVTSSDMAGLLSAGALPYGPAPTSAMQAAVRAASGTPWTTAKPVVLYVGGEYCMYCALQRWALVVALSRFGGFGSLHYMTSGSNEGDLPTFTFAGSTYSSAYIVFRPYELEDRSNPPQPLQTLPPNYSTLWKQYGGGVPFLDFGNSYVVAGSLMAYSSILQGRNWTSIIGSVAASDSAGSQIRQAANQITAVICRLTNGMPSGVCSADPIASTMSGMAGPMSGLQTSPTPYPYRSADSMDMVIRSTPKRL